MGAVTSLLSVADIRKISDQTRISLVSFPEIAIQKQITSNKIFTIYHCHHEQLQGIIIKYFYNYQAFLEEKMKESNRNKFIQELQKIKQSILALKRAFHPSIHPHIVPYQHVELSKKNAFIIRPYFAHTLTDRIHSRPFLTSFQLYSLALQATLALIQLHSTNTVHLDLKTSNFFLNTSGGLFLSDITSNIKPFAVAADDLVTWTIFFETSGQMACCYVAPERFMLRNTSSITPISPAPPLSPTSPGPNRVSPSLASKKAADIFSLGCVLLEIFSCGVVPLDYPQALILSGLMRAGGDNISERREIFSHVHQEASKHGFGDIAEFLITKVLTCDVGDRLDINGVFQGLMSLYKKDSLVSKEVREEVLHTLVSWNAASLHPVLQNPNVRFLLFRRNMVSLLASVRKFSSKRRKGLKNEKETWGEDASGVNEEEERESIEDTEDEFFDTLIRISSGVRPLDGRTLHTVMSQCPEMAATIKSNNCCFGIFDTFVTEAEGGIMFEKCHCPLHLHPTPLSSFYEDALSYFKKQLFKMKKAQECFKRRGEQRKGKSQEQPSEDGREKEQEEETTEEGELSEKSMDDFVSESFTLLDSIQRTGHELDAFPTISWLPELCASQCGNYFSSLYEFWEQQSVKRPQFDAEDKQGGSPGVPSLSPLSPLSPTAAASGDNTRIVLEKFDESLWKQATKIFSHLLQYNGKDRLHSNGVNDIDYILQLLLRKQECLSNPPNSFPSLSSLPDSSDAVISLIEIVTSLMPRLCVPALKLAALDALHVLAQFATISNLRDHVIPSLVSMLSDSSPMVRAHSITLIGKSLEILSTRLEELLEEYESSHGDASLATPLFGNALLESSYHLSSTHMSLSQPPTETGEKPVALGTGEERREELKGEEGEDLEKSAEGEKLEGAGNYTLSLSQAFGDRHGVQTRLGNDSVSPRIKAENTPMRKVQSVLKNILVEISSYIIPALTTNNNHEKDLSACVALTVNFFPICNAIVKIFTAAKQWKQVEKNTEEWEGEERKGDERGEKLTEDDKATFEDVGEGAHDFLLQLDSTRMSSYLNSPLPSEVVHHLKKLFRDLAENTDVPSSVRSSLLQCFQLMNIVINSEELPYLLTFLNEDVQGREGSLLSLRQCLPFFSPTQIDTILLPCIETCLSDKNHLIVEYSLDILLDLWKYYSFGIKRVRGLINRMGLLLRREDDSVRNKILQFLERVEEVFSSLDCEIYFCPILSECLASEVTGLSGSRILDAVKRGIEKNGEEGRGLVSPLLPDPWDKVMTKVEKGVEMLSIEEYYKIVPRKEEGEGELVIVGERNEAMDGEEKGLKEDLPYEISNKEKVKLDTLTDAFSAATVHRCFYYTPSILPPCYSFHALSETDSLIRETHSKKAARNIVSCHFSSSVDSPFTTEYNRSGISLPSTSPNSPISPIYPSLPPISLSRDISTENAWKSELFGLVQERLATSLSPPFLSLSPPTKSQQQITLMINDWKANALQISSSSPLSKSQIGSLVQPHGSPLFTNNDTEPQTYQQSILDIIVSNYSRSPLSDVDYEALHTTLQQKKKYSEDSQLLDLLNNPRVDSSVRFNSPLKAIDTIPYMAPSIGPYVLPSKALENSDILALDKLTHGSEEGKESKDERNEREETKEKSVTFAKSTKQRSTYSPEKMQEQILVSSLNLWKPRGKLIRTLYSIDNTKNTVDGIESTLSVVDKKLPSPVIGLSATQDSRLLLAAHENGRVQGWRIASLESDNTVEPLLDFLSSSTELSAMTTLRTSRRFLLGTSDGHIHSYVSGDRSQPILEWSIPTGKDTTLPYTLLSSLSPSLLSSSIPSLSSLHSSQTTYWDHLQKEFSSIFKNSNFSFSHHHKEIVAIEHSPHLLSGGLILVARRDRRIYGISCDTNKIVLERVLPSLIGDVSTISLSPPGSQWIAVATEKGYIVFIDTRFNNIIAMYYLCCYGGCYALPIMKMRECCDYPMSVYVTVATDAKAYEVLLFDGLNGCIRSVFSSRSVASVASRRRSLSRFGAFQRKSFSNPRRLDSFVGGSLSIFQAKSSFKEADDLPESGPKKDHHETGKEGEEEMEKMRPSLEEKESEEKNEVEMDIFEGIESQESYFQEAIVQKGEKNFSIDLNYESDEDEEEESHQPMDSHSSPLFFSCTQCQSNQCTHCTHVDPYVKHVYQNVQVVNLTEQFTEQSRREGRGCPIVHSNGISSVLMGGREAREERREYSGMMRGNSHKGVSHCLYLTRGGHQNFLLSECEGFDVGYWNLDSFEESRMEVMKGEERRGEERGGEERREEKKRVVRESVKSGGVVSMYDDWEWGSGGQSLLLNQCWEVRGEEIRDSEIRKQMINNSAPYYKHRDQLTDIEMSNLTTPLFYTASRDGVVKVWR